MNAASDRKRVVVALDTGSLSRVAIEAAARLAMSLHAQLEALFVEDASLWRLAALPFASEQGIASARPRRFDLSELERATLTQARQVRRSLEALAAELPEGWTLEVVRGDLIGVVLQRGAGADLLVLGRTRRPAWLGAHGERLARRLERRVAKHPIVAVFDGTPAAERVLDCAIALERRERADVVVAVVAADREADAALQEGVRARVSRNRVGSCATLVLPDAEIGSVAALAKRLRASAVLLPVDDLARAEHEFQGLVDEIACPVILIR